MKEYEIWVILSNSTDIIKIQADYFSCSGGSYNFYLKNSLICCFPINRTIIRNITKID